MKRKWGRSSTQNTTPKITGQMRGGTEHLQFPAGSAEDVSLRPRSASSTLLPLPAVSHLASTENGLFAIIYLCQTLLPATMHPRSHPPQKTDALLHEGWKTPSHLAFAEAPCCPEAGWRGDSRNELHSTSQAVCSVALFGFWDTSTSLPAGAGNLLY